MTKISIKRVSKDKFQNAVEDAEVMGYKLQNQNDQVAILNKSGNGGSFWWHLLFFIFAPVVGNVVYWFYSKHTVQEELQIKVDE